MVMRTHSKSLKIFKSTPAGPMSLFNRFNPLGAAVLQHFLKPEILSDSDLPKFTNEIHCKRLKQVSGISLNTFSLPVWILRSPVLPIFKIPIYLALCSRCFVRVAKPVPISFLQHLVRTTTSRPLFSVSICFPYQSGSNFSCISKPFHFLFVVFVQCFRTVLYLFM